MSQATKGHVLAARTMLEKSRRARTTVDHIRARLVVIVIVLGGAEMYVALFLVVWVGLSASKAKEVGGDVDQRCQDIGVVGL